MGIPLRVMTRFRPYILIEGLDGDAGRTQNQAHSKAEDNLCVRQVRNNFGD